MYLRTLVHTYWTARFHNQEGGNMKFRHIGKLKSIWVCFSRTHGVVRRVTLKAAATDCLKASTSLPEQTNREHQSLRLLSGFLRQQQERLTFSACSWQAVQKLIPSCTLLTRDTVFYSGVWAPTLWKNTLLPYLGCQASHSFLVSWRRRQQFNPKYWYLPTYTALYSRRQTSSSASLWKFRT